MVVFQSPAGSINRDFFPFWNVQIFFPVVIKSEIAVPLNFIYLLYYYILILPTFIYRDHGAQLYTP